MEFYKRLVIKILERSSLGEENKLLKKMKSGIDLNQKESEIYKDKLQKLQEENDELQKIRQKAQSQAFRIALINKVSNIIRASMDISMILHK